MPKTTTMNIADAKRHYAELLGRVAYGGKKITMTRRGKPHTDGIRRWKFSLHYTKGKI